MTIFQFLLVSLSTIVYLSICFEIVFVFDDLLISVAFTICNCFSPTIFRFMLFSLSAIVSLPISFEIVSLSVIWYQLTLCFPILFSS